MYKKYIQLVIYIIPFLYNGILFTFFPELVTKKLIITVGIVFIFMSIFLVYEIIKIYLGENIKEQEKEIIEKTKLYCFNCENYMYVKITKKGTLCCSNCGLVHNKSQ